MEFEQIERTKTIETYRKMRMERYKKEKNPNYIPKKIALPKRKRSIRKKRVTRKKRVSKKYKKVDADELNAEIGQHLSYYCMKNRKSSKFKNRTPCETRTQQINDNCSTKFQADNRKRLYCVKKALK